jgi:hypothetical protein
MILPRIVKFLRLFFEVKSSRLQGANKFQTSNCKSDDRKRKVYLSEKDR